MCIRRCISKCIKHQAGISLIELVMFIIIVSVGLAGVLVVLNTTTLGSANPLLRKQALAIAGSILEEIQLMPLTFCDPDDANAQTATHDATVPGTIPVGETAENYCAATVEGIGAEAIGGITEDRYGGANPNAVNAFFDNVSDYHNFSMIKGVDKKDITGTIISTDLRDYAVSVSVAAVALGTISVASGNALRITVTVTTPNNENVILEGIRTRYAPRTVP